MVAACLAYSTAAAARRPAAAALPRRLGRRPAVEKLSRHCLPLPSMCMPSYVKLNALKHGFIVVLRGSGSAATPLTLCPAVHPMPPLPLGGDLQLSARPSAHLGLHGGT